MQILSTHFPLLEQLLGQNFSEQSSPLKPKKHSHLLFALQIPLLEQLLIQSFSSHAFPVKPDLQ